MLEKIMEQQSLANYNQAIQTIKSAILQSRYRAATLANREMLSLYFGIGKFISENSRNHFWGTNAIETISVRLLQELPGLRGYSPVNLKRMRQFFESWNKLTQNPDIHFIANRPTLSDEIQLDLLLVKSPTVSDELKVINWNEF
jgi:ERCC4-type nuclease